MFGKPYAAYLRFQAPFLIALAVVGVIRLVLSIAGAPEALVKFTSMTLVYFAGVLFYGLRVGRTGFGTYRHLLPLVFNQSFVLHTIAVLGIALSANGLPNVFDAPEFRGPAGSAETTALVHALSHIFIGTTIGTLVGWAISCLTMFIGGRPARQTGSSTSAQ